MSSPGKLTLQNSDTAWVSSFAELGANASTARPWPDLSTDLSNEGGGCTADHFNSTNGLDYTIIVLGVVLVIENILLISVIASTLSLHTNTNILVTSLAVTDVLMGVQCFGMGLEGLGVGPRSWLATLRSDLHAYDSIMVSSSLSLTVVSLLHISALGIDRYLYVLWPFAYKRRVTRARVLATATGIWTLGIIYTMLPLAIFPSAQYRQRCIFTNLPVSFGYGPMGAVYLVCLLVVLYCTVGMVNIARRHRVKRLKKQVGDKILKISSNAKLRGTVFAVAYTRTQFDHVSTVASEHNDIYVKNESPQDGKTLPLSKLPANLIVPGNTEETLQSTSVSSKIKRAASLKNAPAVQENKTGHEHQSPEVLGKLKMPGFEFSCAEAPAFIKDVGGIRDTASSHRNDHSNSTMVGHVDHPNIGSQLGASKILSIQSDKMDCKYGASHEKEKSRVLNKANLKIIKFLLVVFGTFFACTFPSILLLSLTNIFHIALFSDHGVIFGALHILLTSNSGMNFLTITYMNKEFRHALVSTLSTCNVCSCRR